MPRLSSKIDISHSNLAKLNIGSSSIWRIRVLYSRKVYNSVIDWASYGLSQERILLAKKLALHFWSMEGAEDDLSVNETSYRKFLIFIRLLCIAEEFYEGRLFSQYEKADWIKLLVTSMFRVWNDRNDKQRKLIKINEPLSFQMMDKLLSAIKTWNEFYLSGDVNDGPEYIFKAKDVEGYFRSYFGTNQTLFAKWREGGSFGSVNFSVANLLLSDALTILNSKKTEQLLAYFSSVRDNATHDLVIDFWSDQPSNQLGKYRATGNISLLTNTTSGSLRESKSNICKIKLAIPLHKKLLEIDENSENFIFPWRVHRDLLNNYNEVLSAIYVIFLSVMGKRGPSEVLSLRGCDITPSDSEAGRDAVMRPSILKTNGGLRESQGVTNFIDVAFQTLLKLGYVDKSGTGLPLFSPLAPIRRSAELPHSISVSHSFILLDKYYEKFCLRVSSKLDFEVKDIHAKITTHQFRHSFAEFALRRYDGNVEEYIRQHFCHKYNHWWTKRYTADKLDSDYENYLSRKYIKELVPRILADSSIDPDFSGGMALYIKKELTDKVKTVSAADAEDFILSFSEDIIQVTPHEYGWCLIHKKYRVAAQCADENGNPNPLSTDSKKCNRCANFCTSRSSHLAVQTQIAISHLDFIETKAWKMPSIKRASREAVRDAQILFPELLKLGVV